MKIYQWVAIWGALKTVLSYPFCLIRDILENIAWHYSYIAGILLSGRALSTGMVWDLLKWCLLFLFVCGGALFLCIDTTRRVLSSERVKRDYVIDALMIMLILLVYYALLSVGLYVFFNVIVPVAREL